MKEENGVEIKWKKSWIYDITNYFIKLDCSEILVRHYKLKSTHFDIFFFIWSSFMLIFHVNV